MCFLQCEISCRTLRGRYQRSGLAPIHHLSACTHTERMPNRTTDVEPPSPATQPVPRPSKWWYVIAVLAVGVSAYALSVVVTRAYPEPLDASFRARPWGIYPHAFFALIALAVGPWQFRGQSLRRRHRWHRQLGKAYVVAAFVTAITGFYMAFYAHGGVSNKLGFAGLAVALFGTTAIALDKVRQRDFVAHRAWMLRSYALMFAAVTLRLWLPILLVAYQGDFEGAYQWQGWLAWIPNLIWAEWYLARKPAPA